jgi:hypothetical protein
VGGWSFGRRVHVFQMCLGRERSLKRHSGNTSPPAYTILSSRVMIDPMTSLRFIHKLLLKLIMTSINKPNELKQ